MQDVLQKGLTHTSRLTVGREHTALAMGSGDMEVFATPAMVALMEHAAMLAVASSLPEGSTSVGAQMDTTHLRPSAVEAEIEARAELVAVEGRKLTFHVQATDRGETIGEGTHVRFVVDRARFLAKL